MNRLQHKITERFDTAATRYDNHASVQAQAAEHLVAWAAPRIAHPQDILDIGSGTGFVAQIAAQKWPTAHITALDHAPAMLQQAQNKLPWLKIVSGDAAQMDFDRRFDIIFSGMMLHWLPQPIEALKRWQGWLKPQGRMYVALLVEGSFQEWRDLCRSMNVKDGLWVMPPPGFAGDLVSRTEQQTLSVNYPSARDFLHRLKATGAATPRPDHRPVGAVAMRRLLSHASQPFPVTYQVLYMEIPSQGSV